MKIRKLKKLNMGLSQTLINRIASVLLLALIIFTTFSIPAWAQEPDFSMPEFEVPEFVPPQNNYYKGQITKILTEDYSDDPFIPAIERFSQKVEVKVLEGPRAGELMELSYTPGSTGDAKQNLQVGEKILLIQTEQVGNEVYYIADRYRISSVVWLAVAFFILVVAFAGWKGLRSIIGLSFTLLVIIYFILPRVLDGHNPFVTFLLGGIIIALVSIYLGHGLNRRTSVALVSTLITLVISIGVALLSVKWVKLFGLGTEEAFYIQVGDLATLDLQGLLLGGIIIGVLGVLDDITTAQTATIEEIYKANTSLGLQELAKRGMSVGHEHVVSLVNTLALAYVGASFPLLLLFTQSATPLWVTLNSERVIEEIVRTLIGSSALIIAVPITTYLAAYYFSKFGVSKKVVESAHRHPH